MKNCIFSLPGTISKDVNIIEKDRLIKKTVTSGGRANQPFTKTLKFFTSETVVIDEK